MATITAQTPSADKVMNAPARGGRAQENPSRPLWQTTVFLAGVGALVFVWLGRPLGGNVSSRQIVRELEISRQHLGRPDGDARTAADHARRALEQADALPDRQAEANFLLGSAESRLADGAPAIEAVEFWKSARRHLEEAERLGVPAGDRGRLQYRLARTLFYTGEEPESVAEHLASSVDYAEDRAEAYRLLADAYLRLPPTAANLEAALAANEKLRMVFPIAPEVQALAQLQGGELNIRLNRAELARKILEKISLQAPAGVLAQARVLRARSFEAEGRWQESADQWKALLGDTRERLADRGPALYHLGVCLARLGQAQEAAPYWEESLKAGKGDEAGAAALALAEVWLQGPTPEKAFEPLSRVAEGVNGDWRNPLVELKQARDRFEQAIQVYRNASKFDFALQTLDLYQKLAEAGRTDLLRGDVGSEWARARRAAALQLPVGEARAAEENAARSLSAAAAAAYRRGSDAVQGEAREEAVWLEAVCRLDAGDDRGAVEAFNRYVLIGKKPERVGEAWFRLGECHRKNPEPAAQANAESSFQKCIQSQSSFALRARYQLALAMIAGGKLDSAEEALEQNLKLLRLEPDPDVQQKSLFALGGLAFRRNNYRAAVPRLEEALHVDPPLTTAEATKARFQLAESCRQLADQEQKKLLEEPAKTPEESEHIKKEHIRWLLKSADEYYELARFLDAPESAGQLTEEERIQIPFLAAICRFNLGEYDTALDIYDHLATRFVKPAPETPTTLAARYAQYRLEALAGVVRCHAALGRGEQVRKRLEEMRLILEGADDAVREEYDKWITSAAKSLQVP